MLLLFLPNASSDEAVEVADWGISTVYQVALRQWTKSTESINRLIIEYSITLSR